MSTTLRYQLFGIGKLPGELHQAVEQEGLLHLYEGVPVQFSFSGSVPGLETTGNTRTYSGALALSKQRILGTLSVVPMLAGRVLDTRWDDAASSPIRGADASSCGGPVRVTLDERGALLELDVARVHPEFRGQLSLHFDLSFSPEELAALPLRELAFVVPPEYVLKLVGVPH